jgi:hypothetical protein
MKKVMSILLVLLFSQASFSSTINPTKITRVLVGPGYGNTVYITVSVKPTGTPACQVNTGYDYAFDGTTAVGKMTLSVALAAYAAGKDVWLGGSNVCTFNNTVENLAHIVSQ